MYCRLSLICIELRCLWSAWEFKYSLCSAIATHLVLGKNGLCWNTMLWIHPLEFSFECGWLVFWEPVFTTTLLVCTWSQLLFLVCLWTCWCVMTDIDMTHERAACFPVSGMNNSVLIWVNASLPALGAHLCIFLHGDLPEWNRCARVKCIQLKSRERKS